MGIDLNPSICPLANAAAPSAFLCHVPEEKTRCQFPSVTRERMHFLWRGERSHIAERCSGYLRGSESVILDPTGFRGNNCVLLLSLGQLSIRPFSREQKSKWRVYNDRRIIYLVPLIICLVIIMVLSSVYRVSASFTRHVMCEGSSFVRDVSSLETAKF